MTDLTRMIKSGNHNAERIDKEIQKYLKKGGGFEWIKKDR